MKNPKPFSFWAWCVAWIWLGGLITIGGIFIIAFFIPFSPAYGSLNYIDVLKILQEILNNYLPYLGIIFGAYAYSGRNHSWDAVCTESRYSKLIIALSLFFNIIVLVVLIGHLLDKYSDFQVFLNFLRVLNTGLTFFMAWFLTYFFKFDTKSVNQNNN